jgi:hypothetical protein
MADYTFPLLTTAVDGFNSTIEFKSQSTDTFTISTTLGSISVGNLDFSLFNATRFASLVGRRPLQGQLFPRGVYNK